MWSGCFLPGSVTLYLLPSISDSHCNSCDYTARCRSISRAELRERQGRSPGGLPWRSRSSAFNGQCVIVKEPSTCCAAHPATGRDVTSTLSQQPPATIMTDRLMFDPTRQQIVLCRRNRCREILDESVVSCCVWSHMIRIIVIIIIIIIIIIAKHIPTQTFCHKSVEYWPTFKIR